jgi:hypothetical protein
MTTYVDYTYYHETYSGTKFSSETDEFKNLAIEASAIVDYLTHGTMTKIGIPTGLEDNVKLATCKAIDTVKTVRDAAQEASDSETTGPISSESNDGYSVSYATTQVRKAGETDDAYERRLVRSAIQPYLVNTGLLFAGVYGP